MFNEKIKNVTIDNGIVYTDCICQNSVEFTTDMPKNAVVDYVKVNGKTLDNYALNGCLKYPVGVEFEGKADLAIGKFPEGAVNEEIYKLAQVGEVNDFDVYYHEVAVEGI
jgi:hypothetical protein